MKQKFIIHIISIAAMIALMTSCASGKIVLSNDANISKYKYVIFGKETSGDRELDDVVMSVQNQIAVTFYDYNTNQSVAVIKSSGIGMTVSHDQSIALSAIRKKISKLFK